MICSIVLKIQTAYGFKNSTPTCELSYLDENLDTLPTTASAS